MSSLLVTALKRVIRKWNFHSTPSSLNQQVFIAFKPGSAQLRGSLIHENLRPLLRQALVAGCAAVETYVADRTMELLGPCFAQKRSPPVS